MEKNQDLESEEDASLIFEEKKLSAEEIEAKRRLNFSDWSA